MSFTQSIRTGWKSWMPVLLLMLIAAFIRLKFTSDHDFYILEGDGPYYPLQVRSLAENFRMALPDVPLTFIIECLFSKFFQLFTSSSDESILMGIRFADAFLPPLAAIPVYLISQELKTADTKNNFYTYLIVGFAILSFTPVLVFAQCLHKNGIAVIWVFYYLLFFIRLLKYSQQKHLYLALLFLALCAVTHFGSFSILLFFTILAGLVWFFKNRSTSTRSDYQKTLGIFIFLILSVCIIVIFDSGRFNRLITIPFNIFEAPLITYAIKWQSLPNSIMIPNFIVVNLLFFIVLIARFINRKDMNSLQKSTFDTFLLFTFLIINPLLGIDWANRLYIMAYIPLTVLYFMFFNIVKKKWKRILMSTLFFVVIYQAAGTVIFGSDRRILSKEAFSEFKTIDKKMNFSKNSAIVSNRELRLLASWIFRTKSAADYTLTKEDLKRYDNMYFLRQITGEQFHHIEDNIPINSTLVYHGKYFEIYKLSELSQWTIGEGHIPKLRGFIESIDQNKITIFNKFSGQKRIAEFSSQTIIHLNNGDTVLKKGMYVEVWGKGRPFSITIDAEKIIGNKYLIPK
jgi:hypothetical protein